MWRGCRPSWTSVTVTKWCTSWCIFTTVTTTRKNCISFSMTSQSWILLWLVLEGGRRIAHFGLSLAPPSRAPISARTRQQLTSWRACLCLVGHLFWHVLKSHESHMPRACYNEGKPHAKCFKHPAAAYSSSPTVYKPNSLNPSE